MWVRLYRRLLDLLTGPLGDGYRSSMEETFERRLEKARAAGWWALWRVGCRECWALLPLAAGERWRALRSAARLPSGSGLGRERWSTSLPREIRYAFRRLARSPGFAAATVLTLAVGIGANAAIFSAIDAVLLRPSPFDDPDRLMVIWQTDRGSGTEREPASWPDVIDFRDGSRSFATIGAMIGVGATVTGAEGAERVSGLAVTPGFLETLRVEPLEGRSFAPDDWSTGSATSVLLGERYWRERFASDPGVVGQAVNVNGSPATIVGVLPAGADLGIRQIHDHADYARDFEAPVDVWLASLPTEAEATRAVHGHLIVGRLAPDVEVASARRELERLGVELEATYPDNDGRGVNIEPHTEVVFGAARSHLTVLAIAVLLVLLIACVNVVNLLTARALARSREVAMRRALGASRRQVDAQFLLESLVLCGLGAGLGIALALVSLEALTALAPSDLPRLTNASVNWRVVGLTIALSVGVASVLGIVSGWRARNTPLHVALTGPGERRATGTVRARRARSLLVVAEVALAVSLVVSAGVMIRSFWELNSVDPGFETASVLKAQYQVPESWRGAGLARTQDFHRDLLERVRSIPGVEAATVALRNPLDPGMTSSWSVVGREAEFEEAPEIRWRVVAPGYVETLRVSLLEGRGIEATDAATAPRVALVNAAAAARYFPGGNALGQEIRMIGATRRIVGVVGDERFMGLEAPSEPAVYVPMDQLSFLPSFPAATLLARSPRDAEELTPAIRDRLRELDRGAALYAAGPLSALVEESLSSPRFAAVLLGSFASTALLLALIGIYGVLSYGVAQRTTEVGIRMALGAPRGSVLSSVVKEGLLLSALGALLGTLGALAVSGLFESIVYEVSPIDPTTYVVVVSSVVGTALLASLLPALRASRSDPLASLHGDG